MAFKYIKCFQCCRRFTPGTRSDGIPNGVQMQFEDGYAVDICSECIESIGQSNEVFDEFVKKVERVKQWHQKKI